MQPNIKQGLLLACNSEISDQQLNSIIRKDQSIQEFYHLDKDYFARGKFAHVRRIRHKQSGQQFAAKTIKKRRPRAGDVTDEIRHEIRVLMISNNNNNNDDRQQEQCFSNRIVKLYEVFETSHDFTLVLELAEGGELQKVLDEEDSIEEHLCRRIIRQIVEGVKFLHQKRIAHLDIKPQNILLTDALPDGQVKLCDFGISRLIQDKCDVREIMGTTDYMPPEILQYEPISLAADMWSIGIVSYVLLSGHSPFGGDDKVQTYSNITSGDLEFPDKLFASVSESAKDFIQKLLVRDPRDRMNCDECLKHEWLLMDEQKSSMFNEIKMNDETINKSNEDNTSDLDNVDSDLDSDGIKSSATNNVATATTTSSSTFSSIASSLDEAVVDDEEDDDEHTKIANDNNDDVIDDDQCEHDKNVILESRNSGLGGNICDTNDNNRTNEKTEPETIDHKESSSLIDKMDNPSSGHLVQMEAFVENNDNRSLTCNENNQKELDKETTQTAFNDQINPNGENKENFNHQININNTNLSPLLTATPTTNKYNHHKRLSSDISPNRRLIAVVSSLPPTAASKLLSRKFTSESSMFDSDNQINSGINTGEKLSLKTLLVKNNSIQDYGNSNGTNHLGIQSSGDQSPPTTPSKKFYLSVDDYDYPIGGNNSCYLYPKTSSNLLNNNNNNGLQNLDANIPTRRIRSVSMERLNSPQSSCSSSTSTSMVLLDQTNRTCSYSHCQSMLASSQTSTFPLATLETHTCTTITSTADATESDMFAKRIDTFLAANTSMTTTTTTTRENIIKISSGSTTITEDIGDGFRIQVTKPLF